MYDPIADAALSKTVLFVGDSNITQAANALNFALLRRPDGYLPIFTSRNGMGIRGYVPGYCPEGPTCPAPDYWQIRLGHVLAKIVPDVVVCDLGINDTVTPGTATSTGYASYGTKIGWLLEQLPDVPVLWSNLPTQIEPAANRAGCTAVNTAIWTYDVYVPQVTLVDWHAVAVPHPEWMLGVHYTTAGYTAYAELIAATLDALAP